MSIKSAVVNNNLIEYHRNAFGNHYGEYLITDFNHGPMAKGQVNLEIVKSVIETLNQKLNDETRCIYFDKERVEPILIGGSCSSIAFRIAKETLDFITENGIEMSESQDEVVKKVSDVVAKIKSEAKGKSKLTKGERSKLRSLQMGFNTITVNRTNLINRTDTINGIAQAKIKALASYYDLTVNSSNSTMKIDDDFSEKPFNDLVGKLEPGIYLLRVIVNEDNHKMEKHGHSTVLIKFSQKRQLYFDTQIGLYDLNHQKGNVDLIFNSLRSAKAKFDVNVLTFHKLQTEAKPGLPTKPVICKKAGLFGFIQNPGFHNLIKTD